MATETVSPCEISALVDKMPEGVVLVDMIWALLEGINGYAASYEDGGLNSGLSADTNTVRHLGEMAIELLCELKFGKGARVEEVSHV